MRSKLRPAPSSVTASTISLPSWRTSILISPSSGLPLATRSALGFDAVGDGVAQQVLERRGDALEHRAVDLDLAALDVEHRALARFPSPPGARCGTAAREMLANGTMRMRIRFACSSRVSRACADSAISLSPSAFSRFCWTVETSLTLSAIIRVSLLEAREAVELERVERACRCSCASATRDCIWPSAWISISRSCARRRLTFSVRSNSALLMPRMSPSIRLRAIDTSPASLTSRSMRSARTRSIARVAAAGSGSAPCAGAPGFGCSAAFGAAGAAAARGAAGGRGRGLRRTARRESWRAAAGPPPARALPARAAAPPRPADSPAGRRGSPSGRTRLRARRTGWTGSCFRRERVLDAASPCGASARRAPSRRTSGPSP